MKTTSTIIGALGLVALASGCAVEMNGPEEKIGTNEEAISCTNEGATFSVLAGMAVASGREMRRWLPGRDFECVTNNSWEIGVDNTGSGGYPDGIVDYPGMCIRWGSRWQMGTSVKGRARCPNSVCRNTEALLKLQNDTADGWIFGGQPLNPGTLRTRLYSYWQRQFVCINRPDNHTGDDCPVEYHDLAFWYKTTSNVTCDGGFDFWFHSYKMNTTYPLQYPGQLKNMLLWAGGSDNPFLQFNNVNGDVKIDPVGGTAEDSSTTSGSCTVVSYNASLNRCGQVYSATSLTGSCCSCNGVNKTFQPASLADYYKCI